MIDVSLRFAAGIFATAAFAALSGLGCSGSSLAVPGDDVGVASDGASDETAGEAGACGTVVSTDGVGCTYSYTGYNSASSVKADSNVRWSCASGKRTVTANGIPDHDVGTFPNANCPNTISAQSISTSLTLTPALTGSATRVSIVGYAFNGVKFDPATAGTCTSGGSCSLISPTGSWHIEALGQKSFDFGVDGNNAHVQPDGWYHYHGMPEGILTKLAKGKAMTLVGFALDGFPVYARYGYTHPNDATSAIKTVTGSYRLKSAPDAGRPSTSTYPMGAFTEDYEYIAGSGDLDECNGRTGVTPEFPCGIYHYYITDTYPFIGRCEKGTPVSTGGPGGPGGPPGDGGLPPPPGDGGFPPPSPGSDGGVPHP